MVRAPMQRPDLQDVPLVRLLPGRDRRVKAGHPWAFSNEIAMTPAAKALPPGAPVRLEGDDGVRHGVWHFNPHSLIAARRLSGDPAAAIGAAWLRERLSNALALRGRLFGGAPFYRLVHAEADGLPGLVVDRYGDALAVQANTAGMELLAPALLEAARYRFESPYVRLAERLIGKGFELRIFDRSVQVARLLGTNRAYIEREIPHIERLLVGSPAEALEGGRLAVVGHVGREDRAELFAHLGDHAVIDLAGLPELRAHAASYQGLCW